MTHPNGFGRPPPTHPANPDSPLPVRTLLHSIDTSSRRITQHSPSTLLVPSSQRHKTVCISTGMRRLAAPRISGAARRISQRQQTHRRPPPTSSQPRRPSLPRGPIPMGCGAARQNLITFSQRNCRSERHRRFSHVQHPPARAQHATDGQCDYGAGCAVAARQEQGREGG